MTNDDNDTMPTSIPAPYTRPLISRANTSRARGTVGASLTGLLLASVAAIILMMDMPINELSHKGRAISANYAKSPRKQTLNMFATLVICHHSESYREIVNNAA